MAGLAMNTYKTLFLRPDTMTQTTEGGARLGYNASAISTKYIRLYEVNILNWDQFKRLNGQLAKRSIQTIHISGSMAMLNVQEIDHLPLNSWDAYTFELVLNTTLQYLN